MEKRGGRARWRRVVAAEQDGEGLEFFRFFIDSSVDYVIQELRRMFQYVD
jgi:hypothetical protein